MSKTAASKVIMACKLANVQKRLRDKSFEKFTLEDILPVIMEECFKENLVFWFNFLEDSVVLNLRDITHENYELNIRYGYESAPIQLTDAEHYKTLVLLNAFNLTHQEIKPASSATHKIDEKPIQESNIVPPRAIRAAMDTIKGRGDEVTKKAIEKELQFDKMSSDNRRQCIRYLKDMEE